MHSCHVATLNEYILVSMRLLLYINLSITVYFCTLFCFNCIALTMYVENNFVDLGFNNEIEDTCTYVDHTNELPSIPVNPDPNFAVMQLNIRGILSKQDKLKNLIRDIRATGMLHAVMLVETWLTKTTAKRIKIPGFNMFCSHRNKKKGGGVGILITQSLDCRVRDDLSINIPDFENLTVEIKTQQDSIFLSTIYRPPNSKERQFLKTYQRLLKKFTEKQLDRLIVGLDHNMDLMKHDQHIPTSDFIGINLDHQLLPTITKPTRITRSTATLIDNLIIGRSYQTDYTSSIIVDDISDHFPLLLRSSKPILITKRKQEITTRGINPAKCEEINKLLSNYDWHSILEKEETNEAFNTFHTILQNALDTICPIHKIKLTKSKIRKEPWITTGLQKCIRKQKLLYKQQLMEINVETKRRKYLDYRNTLNKVLRRTKENYYKQKCIDFRNNSAKLWKMINRITSKENDKTNCIEYLKIENINYYDSKVIAEEFGKFFSTVGNKFAHSVPTSMTNIGDYIQRIPMNQSSIFMIPTTEMEIDQIINGLANKTSSGHDNINNIY